MFYTVKSLHACALIALLPLAIACAGAVKKTPPISRTLLDHYDLPDRPGWEARLYAIEYGPGVAAPIHHHPVIGMGYVISGSFESAFAGETPAVVHEGQSFTDRALASHVLFRNTDASKPLKFVMTYVVQKGAPVLETP